MTAGALGAWVVQTAAFGPLWAKIRRRERALRIWVAGIAARLAGLGAVAGAAVLAGRDAAPAAAAYGLTIMVLLWAEGWWLAGAPADGPVDGADGADGPGPGGDD